MDVEKGVSKYVAFCGKVYDFFGMCWRGKKKHTPETLKISQRRGTWIVSLFLVFAAIGAFMDEEEESVNIAEEEEIAIANEEGFQTETLRSDDSKPSPSSYAYKPSVSVYVCSKCATVVTASSQPRLTKCPNSNGMHQWDNIGSKGDTVYQCGKCGASIYSQPTPKPGRCPRGLGHNWERL